jgi:predicted amidohydrolase
MTTGPLHWQLLVRSRALDSQLWVAAVCCARDAAAGYVAYGHSMLVGPMGNVVVQAQEQAAIVEGDVVVQQCIEVPPPEHTNRSLLTLTPPRCPAHQARQSIPVIAKLRPDVYGSPNKE